jgi:hypothetical protein
MRVPGTVSALSYLQLASSQSLRGLQYIQNLSALSFAQFASALSLRSAIQLGSVNSVFYEAKLCGGRCSVLDFMSLGSALSLRASCIGTVGDSGS